MKDAVPSPKVMEFLWCDDSRARCSTVARWDDFDDLETVDVLIQVSVSASIGMACFKLVTAMTEMVSDLLTAADSKSPSVLLSLDISTAFDTLDHHRLLQQAKERFGFDDLVVDWIQLYLAGRRHLSQWMVIEDQKSSSPLLCLWDRYLDPSYLLFSLCQWGSWLTVAVFHITSMLTTLSCDTGCHLLLDDHIISVIWVITTT